MKATSMNSVMGKLSAVMVAAIALLALNAPALAAQKADQLGGKGPGMRMIDLIDRAASGLTLEDAQKTSIHAIITDATAQASAIATDMKGSTDKEARQAARTKLQELAQQTTEKVSAVLNEEQKAAFRKALSDERAKLKQAHGGRRGGKQPAAK